MWKTRGCIAKKLKVFQRQYLKKGNKKLVNMELSWSHLRFGDTKTWWICLTQRLKIRRQVAEMLGKRRSAFLEMFSEDGNAQLEHDELAYLATFHWVKSFRDGKLN